MSRSLTGAGRVDGDVEERSAAVEATLFVLFLADLAIVPSQFHRRPFSAMPSLGFLNMCTTYNCPVELVRHGWLIGYADKRSGAAVQY